MFTTYTSTVSGSLTAGDTYWLSLGNANDSGGTQFDAWDLNNGPATCNFAQVGQNRGDCGAGGNAFTLNGTVPEPGTLVMLGGGIVAVAGTLRRRLGSK